MLTTRSQRWRTRRASFVDNLSVIDPRRYAVDALETPIARAFIADHHYLPSYPAARLAVGLFGPGPGGRSALAGVAVFGVPTTGAVITRHAGLAEHQGCTLSRLILLDDVAGNGESFFIARALRLLRRDKPEIEAVVSYSDPMAGHIGQVYCASNAAYRGRTAPRTGYAIGGTPISGRSLSKIRLGEQGAAGAVDQLVALGAPPPAFGEALATWLSRLHRDRTLQRTQRPGLFAYCFELTRRARARGRTLPRHPYPKLLPPRQPMLPFAA